MIEKSKENGVHGESDDNTKYKSVHLDEVLSKFGLYKPYQIQALTLLGITFLINGMHCINFIFVTEESHYRCNIEQCELPNKTFSSPWYNYTAPDTYKSCDRYGLSHNTTECLPDAFNTSNIQPCTEFIYEANNSFVSEFGLACQEWKRTFVGTIHNIGLMVGLLIQGQLSDKIGRKAAIIIAGVSSAVFGVTKSFAKSYHFYILFEFLEATFGDNCSPAFIMSVELVDSGHRLNQQIILCSLYAIGGILLSVAAYYLQYWRQYLQAIYAPSLLFILYYFFMDESVRWLLSKGRKDEAIRLLKKIAKRNKVELDEKMLLNLKCEEEGDSPSSPLIETFKSKIVVKRFFICLIWWMSCTFICFGLLINALSLAGNKYINFAIMSLADVPVSFSMVYVLKRFNRQKPLIASFVAAGVLCIVQTFVPAEYPVLSVGLYLSGKFLSTFTFATVYLYTSELFPTYSRNFMHALCSSIGRIGSVIAPMTPLLMRYSVNLPTVLIGIISIFAGLVTILVPDIANDSLPDNVRQAETLGGACPTVVVSQNSHKMKNDPE